MSSESEKVDLSETDNLDQLIKPGSKLPFVTPVVIFLIAGLTKLVSWDVGFQGLLLLVLFATVGFVLPLIPRRSRLWNPPLGSSYSTLKQTIATARVLVSIVVVIIPALILAMNDQVLNQLPKDFDDYLSHLADPTKKEQSMLVFIPKEGTTFPKEETNVGPLLYAGKYIKGSSLSSQSIGALPGPSLPSTTVQVTPSTTLNANLVRGELYVLQTTQIIDSITKDQIRPLFYQFATVAVLLAAVFTFVIFFMEILGDVVWGASKALALKQSRTNLG